MKTPHLERIIPEYPRTRHLPHKANAKRDDLIATLDEVKAIWVCDTAVQEKIDGAQCRMAMVDGHPVIGNRNHILDKAYSKSKIRNASKKQFTSIWGWWYEHRHLFEALEESGPFSVYGDWMYMQHGMCYDALPSLFMAYDVYDHEVGQFLNVRTADELLRGCGFSVVPLLHYGPIDGFEQLELLANEPTPYAEGQKREGVYLKVCNSDYVTERFKMVRDGFEQGKYLSQTGIMRNEVKS